MHDLSSIHSIGSPPFESFYRGSWHATEFVSIINGKTFVRINHHGSAVEEEICGDYIRLRSRKANDCDCLNLLKVGVDVCVLSTCLTLESSVEPQPPLPQWYDAKIVSKNFNSPHEGRCSCLFSVILYKERSRKGIRNNILFERAEAVTIDKIAILQKLNYELCADGFYRWRCSEDCTSYGKSKLLSGLISSQISWLVVLSILKGMYFHIKTVHGNIVYQILEKTQDSVDNNEVSSPKSVKDIITMHFKRFTEPSCPVVKTLASFVLGKTMEAEKLLEMDSQQDMKETSEVDNELDGAVFYDQEEMKVTSEVDSESDIVVLYDSKSLRQSKHHQDIKGTTEVVSEPDVEVWYGSKRQSKHQQEMHETSEVDSSSDVEVLYDIKSLRRSKRQKIQPDRLTSYSSPNFGRKSKRDKPLGVDRLERRKGKHTSLIDEEKHMDNLDLCRGKKSSVNVEGQIHLQSSARKKISDVNLKEIPSQSILVLDADEICEEHLLNVNLKEFSSQNQLRVDVEKICKDHTCKEQDRLKECGLGKVVRRRRGRPRLIEKYLDNLDLCRGKKSSDNVEGQIHLQSSARKKISDVKLKEIPSQSILVLDAEEICEEHLLNGNLKEFPSQNQLRVDVEKTCKDHTCKEQDRLKECGLGKVVRRRRGRPRLIDRERSSSHSGNSLYQKKFSYRKKLLSSVECMQLIQKCIGNIKAELETQFQPEVQSAKVLPEEEEDFIWFPPSENQIEVEEHEGLWKEMEHSLIKLVLLEQKQEVDSESFSGTVTDSNEDGGKDCQHDFKLDEEIGIMCRYCNFMHTEIRDVMPPFVTGDGLCTSKEFWGKEGSLKMGSHCLTSTLDNVDLQSSIIQFGENDTIWALIPEIKLKLYDHQKKAFEFIWRNLAGSLKPKEMEVHSGSRGGCIISHSPGSGKTLLLISFIISYLTLFPKSRPLILAPKIAICVWIKEFEKWGVQFPLHILHPVESYRKETWDCKIRISSSDQRKPNRKMRHVMDSLAKLQQWHEKSSILLMSYSTFASMQKDSKSEHRKFMSRVLQKSPGLLVLDEGHNPRSTNSKLRNLLMCVKTKSRVLLSGTLFQNNFEEYFNTLWLARPSFVGDVIKELYRDISHFMSVGIQKSDKRSRRKERIARKLFVQRIGEKITSSMEGDRKQGFDVLNNITSSFIDIYENGNSNKLPGLHIYTLVLMPTDIQHEVLVRLEKCLKHTKIYPIELELLISVASIHPWLVKTMVHVNEYFNDSELENIEKHKGNILSGSKTKFVFDLVHKSTIEGEKVLIFSHNIPPINLLVKLFENLLGWSKGDEVLVLQGNQELSLRSKIMDRFNEDVENRCKLLIASTSACAEGISLTAASRVVLLDSEWNHSKTKQAIARAFRPGQEREVYVYKLLASETWEEEKFRSNEWKAWLSKMIYSGQYIEQTSCRKVDVVEDKLLRELIEEDQGNMFKVIMKQDH